MSRDTLRAVAGRKLKIIAIAAGVVVLGLGAGAWSMWPEVDDIPEHLRKRMEFVLVDSVDEVFEAALEEKAE